MSTGFRPLPVGPYGLMRLQVLGRAGLPGGDARLPGRHFLRAADEGGALAALLPSGTLTGLSCIALLLSDTDAARSGQASTYVVVGLGLTCLGYCWRSRQA